ncbi:hypothetical protein Goari_014437 [Gossypium aridum]|uniref:Uncharacterized protein n=1 Tax=Gossypium aridum TaxID=34290 RepID=A0A7J8XHS8_GOSAI|nr:hypothetical protein [Gossypium aridum]
MDVSTTQLQLSNLNKVDATFSKKKKKSSEASEPNSSTSLIGVATFLRDNIMTVGLELSEIEYLTDNERIDVLIKIPDHPMQIIVFLSLPPSMRLA